MGENAVESESVEQAVEPSASAASDEQLIAMLVNRARGEGLQLSGEDRRRRHVAGLAALGGRNDRRVDVPERQASQRQQRPQDRAELVCCGLPHGGEAPIVHQSRPVVDTEVRLGVADVDDQQHAYGPTSSGGPACTTSWPRTALRAQCKMCVAVWLASICWRRTLFMEAVTASPTSNASRSILALST